MRRLPCSYVLLLLLMPLVTDSVALAKKKKENFKIWTVQDQFKPGIITVRTTPVRVKSVKFGSPWFASIEHGYIYSEDGSFGMYIATIEYFGPNWMFWDKLTVKAGADVRDLELIGQPHRETTSGGVREHCRFEVPGDLLNRMTQLQQVDFRINGKYYYDFFLNSIGTSYLTRLANYVQERTPEVLREEPIAESGIEGANESIPSYILELRELAKLRDEKIITEEEFQKKKAILLEQSSQKEEATEGSPRGSNPEGGGG